MAPSTQLEARNARNNTQLTRTRDAVGQEKERTQFTSEHKQHGPGRAGKRAREHVAINK